MYSKKTKLVRHSKNNDCRLSITGVKEDKVRHQVSKSAKTTLKSFRLLYYTPLLNLIYIKQIVNHYRINIIVKAIHFSLHPKSEIKFDILSRL